MPASLGEQKETAGVWVCSWCKYRNVRQHAGVDNCSSCGAAALTCWTGTENELRVRYTFPPRPMQKIDACGLHVRYPDLIPGKTSP